MAMPTPPPPTRPSLKVVKSMNWKGSPRLWTTRYYMSGGTPADAGHWTTLSDAVAAAEALALTNRSTIVRIDGTVAGSEVPVHSKVYSTAGSAAAAGGGIQAAEVAALVRYATGVRSAKNHPIYLFNYYHGVYNSSSSAYDTIDSAIKTAISTYANKWCNVGFSDGTNTYKRTGPYGHDAIAFIVQDTLTHRDFR